MTTARRVIKSGGIGCIAGLLIGAGGGGALTFIGVLNDVPREGVHTFSSDATLVVISFVIAGLFGAIAGAIIGAVIGVIGCLTAPSNRHQ